MLIFSCLRLVRKLVFFPRYKRLYVPYINRGSHRRRYISLLKIVLFSYSLKEFEELTFIKAGFGTYVFVYVTLLYFQINFIKQCEREYRINKFIHLYFMMRREYKIN